MYRINAIFKRNLDVAVYLFCCFRMSMMVNSPNSGAKEADFVEVLDEPYHKPFIQNLRVNIFIAKVDRNRTTLYHRHKENTVYTVVAGSYCETQVLGADVRVQEYVIGDCFSGEYRLEPLIHRVECLNESPSDAWFVGCEILQDNSFVSENVLEHNHYIPISKVNIPGCRAYRLRLALQETTRKHFLHFSGVFISLTNGELQINNEELEQQFPLSTGIIEKGHVTWFDGPIEFEIQNVGSTVYEAILLLLA